MLLKQHKEYASLGVLFVCTCALLAVGSFVPSTVSPPEQVPQANVGQAVSEGGQAVPTMPSSLRIPRLNMEASFAAPLGLRSNQEVEVPTDYDAVGWYQHSPVPGQLGPSVVLGHVDSRNGPAVFYSLGQLQVGDDIIIEQTNGQELTFVVTASDRYEQSSFPTELVYGDIDHAGLRLVTCSGWYNKETDRYSHNRVVFAKLKHS